MKHITKLRLMDYYELPNKIYSEWEVEWLIDYMEWLYQRRNINIAKENIEISNKKSYLINLK